MRSGSSIVDLMELQRLRILHYPKKTSSLTHETAPVIENAFHLETCQRWLTVFSSSSSSSFVAQSYPSGGSQPHCYANYSGNYYEGRDAYLFLLRLASGLESEILGETDVFGQVKDAWRQVENSGGPLVNQLGPWMRRIFEDTKEIRTRYLQNLGGTSYGTLVRKLIRDQNSAKNPAQNLDPKKPTFLVGAGQIAQSIAPFLLESDLWIWNRSPDRLTRLYDQLSTRTRPNKTGDVSLLEDESKGWREAATIVICTPFDSISDPQRMSWLSQRKEDCTLIHLGGMREHSGEWQSQSRFFCLNDLFSLQNSLRNVRSVQIAHAARACEERADQRALNLSLPVCHQWETVATFA